MTHDPTKVQLGSTTWSGREVSSHSADPATFKAGLAVRLSAAGSLELSDDNAKALIGISLGRDLSNSKQTAVVRTGLGVPLRIATGDEAAVVNGAKVYTNDAGFGCASAALDATATNASYDGGILTGVEEDGTTTSVALVDMPGGL